jgi:heat shock protein HslJ
MHFVAAPAGVQPPSLDVPTFVGAHWKLVKAVDANGTDVPITGDIPFFVADDGKLTASDGCNTLTGIATGLVDVHFTNVGGTEIGCDTAQVIRAVLSGTAHESVLDATMTLQKDGAGELTYQWVPADKSATDPQALYFKNWHLVSIAGERPVDHPPTVDGKQGDDLYATPHAYSAFTGCTYGAGGRPTVGPGVITFSGVPKSVSSCSGTAADQAATVLSFLRNGALWAIRDGDLVIWDGAGGQAFALVYATDTPPPPTTNPADALIGKTWYLDGIQHLNRALGTPVTVTVTLTFDANGGVRLADSCDDADGRARITASTVDFIDMQGETHSCPSGPGLTNSDHDVVWQVLDGLTNWTLDGAQLTITKDRSTLVFRSSPPQAGRLFGHKWMLDNRESGNSEGSYDWAAGAKIPYLQFYDTGVFTGRDACVRLNGTVAVQGNTLSFGHINIYGRGCKNSDTPYFQDILTTDVAWTFSHGELRLSAHGVTLGFLGP